MDPHIHVAQRVVEAGAGFRSTVTSLFGVVPDTPGLVTTGCGLRVPYAMTSPRPESVTCLACREHAHREYLRFADQVENLSSLPNLAISGIDSTQAAEAVARLRDLAKRFAGSD
jgi:hypothetical protein